MLFHGQRLMVWFVLPLGCTARLLACLRTWRAGGFAWFLSAAVIGLMVEIAAAFVGYGRLVEHFSEQAEGLSGDEIRLEAFMMAMPRPDLLVAGWFGLAVAALEGLLCIGFAAAHHRLQPRHATRLYVSGLLNVVVAALLLHLSGRGRFDEVTGPA